MTPRIMLEVSKQQQAERRGLLLQSLLLTAAVGGILLLPSSAFRRMAEGLAQRLAPLPLTAASQGQPVAAAAVPTRPAAVVPATARQPQPPQNCQVPTASSPFARTCTLLEQVCVDQGRLILYDPKYRPISNGRPVDLPSLKPPYRQARWYFPFRNSRHRDLDAGLPEIHTRPASDREPRQYLTRPAFSNCTVPVVFYLFNGFNFAHVFRDNAARMFSILEETGPQWAAHYRLVIMTGEGLPIAPLNRALWEPLSELQLTSWAEFSTRLRDGEVGPGAPPAPDAQGRLPSFEGPEQRCFQQLFVCLRDVAPAHWHIHGYGQHLVKYYGGQQLVRDMPEMGPPSEAAAGDGAAAEGSAAAAAASAAAGAGAASRKQQPGGERPRGALQAKAQPSVALPPVSALRLLRPGGERLLRVMVSKRNSEDRQLVNAGELVEACNRWRYEAPSGARVRALCWEVETPSLQAGVAALQQADILVGAHGANLANAFLMRPGSSVVELTMYEWEEWDNNGEKGHTPPHAAFPLRNMQDDATQLAWWKLLLCDPEGSWTPGRKEARARERGEPLPRDSPKYRNLIVRWEALRTALEAVVDNGGDMAAYRRKWQAGKWWWLSTNTSTIFAGPERSLTCKRARQQGMID